MRPTSASKESGAPPSEVEALKGEHGIEGNERPSSEDSGQCTRFEIQSEDQNESPEVTSVSRQAAAADNAAAANVDGLAPATTGACSAAADADKAAKPGAPAPDDLTPLRQSYKEIAGQFAWLGWGAFGGPSAHIGLFQKEFGVHVFVEKRKWISAGLFLELLALCQFMPGPTSTQQAYALGVTQQGVTGGFVSGFLFQFPGLLIASLVGWGAANFLRNPAPWLVGLTSGGLAAVGVALVASAAKGLTKATCKDRLTMSINAAAAIITFYYRPTWIFPAVLAAGGLITLVFKRKEVSKSDTEAVERLGVGRILGTLLVATFFAILITSIIVRTQLNYPQAKVFFWFEAMWRIGSLIFGGGQVVLPMLETAFVEPGWMTAQEYFTGIALIQAMPGPLFNISAYIGAVIAIRAHVFALIGIVVCWIGINGPGLLLLYGLLPWWGSFRRFSVYRRALPGLNAAAVGLIVAAVFVLGLQIYDHSPFPNATLCIGIIGFACVDFLNVPAPLAVLAGGVLGIIAWATGMN